MAVGPKPIVLITGAAGNIGTALAVALQADYRVVGMEVSCIVIIIVVAVTLIDMLSQAMRKRLL